MPIDESNEQEVKSGKTILGGKKIKKPKEDGPFLTWPYAGVLPLLKAFDRKKKEES